MPWDEQNRKSNSLEKNTDLIHNNPKPPKIDFIISLIALTWICIVALCLFLLGLNPKPIAGLVFWGFPLMFFFSMLTVPFSLVLGIWSLVKQNVRYKIMQKTIRKFLLIMILLLSLSYPIWSCYLPVYGVRVRVEITGGVDELQKWAIHILDMPIDEVYDKEAAKNGVHIIRKELYSPQMLKISPGWVNIITYENEEPFLNILLAGGFLPGWGIRVGHPSFRPPYSDGVRYFQWSNGVYGFFCN
jgi:hypothetical protein